MRLLPVTIIAVTALLGLRGADLWTHIAPAQAQTPPPQGGAAKPPATPPAAAKPGAAPAANAAKPGEPAKPAEPPKPAVEAPYSDGTEFSAAEVEILQGLAARRDQLDKRATDLEQREALLKAAEKRIEVKLKELKDLQAKVESVVRRYDDEEDQRKKSMVKIFETMKPKDAARIFEQMDLPVLVPIMERMKEAKAAPVLAEMHPARAKQVTAELVKRRQPGLNEAVSPSAPEAPPAGG
jgi:flagellar motility protein MotE (MotC chaperone)